MTRPHHRQTKAGPVFVDPSDGGALIKNAQTGVWRRADDHVPVWVTRDDRKMTIAEMGTEHIQRCIANILIRGNWRLGYLPLLIEELERRTKAGA